MPENVINPPDRAGKGGRPKKVVEMPEATVAEPERAAPTPAKRKRAKGVKE
jgi:hypothetical protein